MKFVSYIEGDSIRAGLWLDDQIMDLARAASRARLQLDCSSMLAIVRGGDATLAAVRELERRHEEWPEALRPATGVRLLAPIPAPVRNPFCVGRNYVDHVKEGFGARSQPAEMPKVPQFFTKATHALCGPADDVRLDARVTGKLDYEVELAVIIGRGGRDIAAADAFAHVFGYAVANDVTARDLQRAHDQWFKGKSLDTTLPMGTWIIDRDSLGDIGTLELSLAVNGAPRQRALASQMIFDIPTIIASLSAGLTLEAGDIIATGTPAGVGFAMQPPCYLRPGDVMEARIDRIGTLRNRIVAA